MLIHRFPDRIVVHTPAKLNLFLEVLAKRPDGFHEIETLMRTVALYDTLVVQPTNDGQIHLDCHWAPGLAAGEKPLVSETISPLGSLPPPEKNLVVRALTLLQRTCPTPLGARVQLLKRIPAAAGLGGASSDAAAALVAANQLWSLSLSSEQLQQVAAQLGSDVPFFLGPAAAICRGKGEIIEPVRPFRLHVVVVRPPEGLATPDVFRRCQPADKPASVDALLADLTRGDLAAASRHLVNRLQAPAAALSPWIGRLAKEFARLDCLGHQMSGSGSSYFGICRNATHAGRLASQLRSRNLGSIYCTTTA